MSATNTPPCHHNQAEENKIALVMNAPEEIHQTDHDDEDLGTAGAAQGFDLHGQHYGEETCDHDAAAKVQGRFESRGAIDLARAPRIAAADDPTENSATHPADPEKEAGILNAEVHQGVANDDVRGPEIKDKWSAGVGALAAGHGVADELQVFADLLNFAHGLLLVNRFEFGRF